MNSKLLSIVGLSFLSISAAYADNYSKDCVAKLNEKDSKGAYVYWETSSKLRDETKATSEVEKLYLNAFLKESLADMQIDVSKRCNEEIKHLEAANKASWSKLFVGSSSGVCKSALSKACSTGTMSKSFAAARLTVPCPLGGNVDEEFIVLKSQEAVCFKVEKKVAQESETIKNLIVDSGTQGVIPLPNINAKVVNDIFTIISNPNVKGKASDERRSAITKLLPNDLNDLAELIKAANYLDIKDLLESGAKDYAQLIFGNYFDLSEEKWGKLEKQLSVFPKDIQNIVVSYAMPNFRYIDRIFPGGQIDEAHREGRRDAASKVPLQIIRIVDHVAKRNRVFGELPLAYKEKLAELKFTKKILFGPVNFKIWPNSCPLPGLPDYMADADDMPDARYVDNNDGTVTDVCTRIIWEKTPAEAKFDWEDANEHCADLVKANSKDWYLPTITELASLIDKTKTDPNPKWNQVFGRKSDWYWSSSSAGSTLMTWVVNFGNGGVLSGLVLTGNRVRCVR